MANKLVGETSPYLLQHAENPVEWYPWGEEALARAREEDKPILLSIGYAACHWCHVMAHESFEDPTTAAIMNRYFVNIKVDREERPDVDSIYMSAIQALHGQGGWPLTAFLTADGRPFYGGTYYPPTPRYGMPSFTQVLESVAGAWQTRRDEIETSAEGITAHLNQAAVTGQQGSSLHEGLFDQALQGIRGQFDSQEGGFSSAPKFPPSMTIAASAWRSNPRMSSAISSGSGKMSWTDSSPTTAWPRWSGVMPRMSSSIRTASGSTPATTPPSARRGPSSCPMAGI
jgi:uncharacterized protein YyaL (SSP411 family)